MAKPGKKAGKVAETAAVYGEPKRLGPNVYGKAEKPRRKNHFLYQSKIDMARELLGAATETEAIDTALDLLIYGEALARGTAAMKGEEYHDVLGVAAARRKRA